MSWLQSKVSSPSQSVNPFLSSSSSASTLSSTQSQPVVDLFSAADLPTPAAKKASEDLLQLGNPFTDVYTQPVNPPIFAQPPNIWMANTNGKTVDESRWCLFSSGFSGHAGLPLNNAATNGPFVSDSNFSSVFGNTGSTSKCFVCGADG